MFDPAAARAGRHERKQPPQIAAVLTHDILRLLQGDEDREHGLHDVVWIDLAGQLPARSLSHQAGQPG
ncbi:MAG: hypothetical protein ACKOEM_20680 [Planctomycetia bacterium]